MRQLPLSKRTQGHWMSSNRILLASAMAMALSPALAADLPSTKGPAPAPSSPVPFFFVNDNTVSLSYRFTATDPGDFTPAQGSGFGKSILNFTHFDVWGYGTNFFTIDLLKSGALDPAAPCFGPGPGCPNPTGSTEIYGLIRSTLGFNELFHTKAFSMGPLLDVSFEIGGDANTQNNYVGPAKRDIVAGLEFTFALPYKGHLNISPLYYKEWNHNNFLTPGNGTTNGPLDGNDNFNGTWDIETNYSMDLGFLPEALPLTLSGFANFHGAKGTGISAAVPVAQVRPTAVEFNSQTKLSLDLGKIVGGSTYSHFFDVWVAYDYWQNKFGLDHAISPVCLGVRNSSCTEQTVEAGVSIKF